jgi:small subunit ribosomal protein S6
MERIYESMVIIRPDLNEDEREGIINKIAGRIKELGGRVLDSKIWAKERNFCYPIRSRGAEKRRYNRGLYWLLNFTLDTEKLFGLKETIRLEEKILRSIIIRK